MDICEADITPGCLLLIPKTFFAYFYENGEIIPTGKCGLLLLEGDLQKLSNEVVGFVLKIIHKPGIFGNEAVIRIPQLSIEIRQDLSAIERNVNSFEWKLVPTKKHG